MTDRSCGAIDCVNECGGDDTWETCPHAIAKRTIDTLSKFYAMKADPADADLLDRVAAAWTDEWDRWGYRYDKAEPAGFYVYREEDPTVASEFSLLERLETSSSSEAVREMELRRRRAAAAAVIDVILAHEP